MIGIEYSCCVRFGTVPRERREGEREGKKRSKIDVKGKKEIRCNEP